MILIAFLILWAMLLVAFGSAYLSRGSPPAHAGRGYSEKQNPFQLFGAGMLALALMFRRAVLNLMRVSTPWYGVSAGGLAA